MKKFIYFLLLSLVVLFAYGCGKDEGGKVYYDQSSVEMTEGEEEVTTFEYVYVHIYGAVNTPGVYKVSKGTRVFEALDEAGGATEEGNIQAINLAKPVSDEMQIYVPTYEEVEKSEQVSFWQEESANDDGLININTATKEELITLPGIGESRAEAIISYREENGGFSDITDVMKVSGIKEAAYDKIKEKIKV